MTNPRRPALQFIVLAVALIAAAFFYYGYYGRGDDNVFPISTAQPQPQSNDPQPQTPNWSVLHANQARTASLQVHGVRSEPLLLFDRRDTKRAVFSGTMIGPQNDLSLGVGSKLYRCLGPGPISFDPPEGIPLVVGFTSAVEVRHPETGELLNRRKFNLGLFTNFPSIDEQGFVYVPDWARLSKYSPGMTRLEWAREFDNSISDLFANVPAGNAAFLPDGNVLIPFLGGMLYVIDAHDGSTISTLDLKKLDPPIQPDPQFDKLNICYRNGLVLDREQVFVLLSGEMIRLIYDEDRKELSIAERTEVDFSSSTPTLDIENKRLFIVTYDPEDAHTPPQLVCYDYDSTPMTLRWSAETNIDFFESEDQLTNTYLPTSGVILNNSLYGHVTAYIEIQTPQGPQAKRLWSTKQTVSPEFGAYIATASDLDNTVYVVDNFIPRLYALDAMDGSVLWSFDLPDRSIKKPIVAPGTIYLDHHSGILALQAEK